MALANACERVLALTFSGCQNRGPGNAARNARLASFHRDELALYPRSLVFEYGSFQTGVKVRWPNDSIDEIVWTVKDQVAMAWLDWSPSLKYLVAHADGEPAN